MQRENGIVIGVVADLDDPERLGRVRVKLPYLNDEVSDWSRLATPMGGRIAGCSSAPRSATRCWSPASRAIRGARCVVGALWSKVDPPPEDDGNPTDNNWRFFQSRSGHLLKFDDTASAERIEIIGTGGDHKLVIDVSGRQIQITCSSGDVAISAPTGKVSIDANAVEIKATTSLSLEAQGALTVKGTTVAIN